MATLRVETDESNFVAGLRKASGSVGALAGKINEDLVKSFRSADFYSKNFEKGIGRLGKSFKDVGMGLTVGLTLPLGLLAKSASDAYAEFDSLKKGLSTLEPTAEKLNSRLSELRELAKAPGIGFQEAIQGDVRLRSVGIAAATSAKILKEFANAVALTGGGKAQLNEITIQLGQMAAKGKVLAQDLRPIIEAAPAVSQALKNMFGTVSSEAISEALEKAGKSSTDMIEMLLEELSKAPRVTGGWKNALENLGISLFMARAEMVETADNLFNLQGIIASITRTVEGAVEGFKALPEPVQKTILGVVAMAAILGPLAVGISIVTSALTSMVTVGALTVTTVTGIVAVIGALSYAFMDITAKANDMVRANESIESITKSASVSIQGEVDKITSLIDILKDQKSSTEDVLSAKKSLIAINPSFQDALKGEMVNYDLLGAELDDYIDKLITASEIKALNARMDENNRKKQMVIDDPRSIMNVGEKGFVALAGLFGYEDKDFDNRVKYVLNSYDRANEKIAEEIARKTIATNKKIKERTEIIPPIIPPGGSKDTDSKAKQLWSAEEKYRSMIRTGRDKWIDKLNEDAKIENEINEGIVESNKINQDNLLKQKLEFYRNLANLEGPQTTKDENKIYKELGISTPDQIENAWDKRIEAMMKGQAKALKNRKKFDEKSRKLWEDQAKEINKELTGLLADSGAQLVEGLFSGNGLQNAFKSILNAFGTFAIQTGKSLLPVMKLLEMLKAKPGVGTAIALIAGGAAVRGIASRINVPKLADGGMATNPTLAMIGDNKSGKEMVLPFERTGEFATKIAQQMGGGNGNFSVATKISGNDLLILVERAKKTR